jgi:hypothetical protein
MAGTAGIGQQYCNWPDLPELSTTNPTTSQWGTVNVLK